VSFTVSSQDLETLTIGNSQVKLSVMTKPWKLGSYDLIDLRVFAAVAQNGTVLAAASQRHLAPSSVSQRITQLESSLGVKLFERHARGLRMTSAGQVMLAHVNRLTATLEQMHVDLAPYATAIHGHVTLLANSNAIASFLPGDMKSFLLTNPNVRVSLQERLSMEIEQAVLHGRAELGIVARSHASPELSWTRYRQDELVLISSQQHPVLQSPLKMDNHPQAVRFVECLDHPFVCLPEGSAIHTFVMNQARQLGRQLDVRVRVAGYPAVIDMVASGVGLGVVPRTMVRDAPVQILRLNEPWALRSLYLCRHPVRPLSPYGHLLFDHLSRVEFEA
jgi:DNA-binding transcriptional LysR family regulator